MQEFTPYPLPVQLEGEGQQLADSLIDVQQEISNALQTAHDFDIDNRPPTNVEEGMVRYADGVSWDPGVGRGLYYYDGTQWQKIPSAAGVASVFVTAGYGGLRQSIPNQAGGNIGLAWQTFPFLDVSAIESPVGVIQDPSGGAISLTQPGVWQVTIGLALEHDSSNAGRTTYIRMLLNPSGRTSNPLILGIGRNQEATTATIVSLFDVGTVEDPPETVQVQIGNGSTLTDVVWNHSWFEVVHVGLWHGVQAGLP